MCAAQGGGEARAYLLQGLAVYNLQMVPWRMEACRRTRQSVFNRNQLTRKNPTGSPSPLVKLNTTSTDHNYDTMYLPYLPTKTTTVPQFYTAKSLHHRNQPRLYLHGRKSSSTCITPFRTQSTKHQYQPNYVDVLSERLPAGGVVNLANVQIVPPLLHLSTDCVLASHAAHTY